LLLVHNLANLLGRIGSCCQARSRRWWLGTGQVHRSGHSPKCSDSTNRRYERIFDGVAFVADLDTRVRRLLAKLLPDVELPPSVFEAVTT
jgi:hypothetical protein